MYVLGTPTSGCCSLKKVKNAPSQDLNGLYLLKSQIMVPSDPHCADGCIYMKDNDDYCFMNVNDGGADIQCEVGRHYINLL